MVYGSPSQTGKVICYSGEVKINTPAIKTTPLQNGFSYQLPAAHNYSTPIELSLEGVDDISYAMIESPFTDNSIELTDGLPETFEIRPNTTYIARVDKHASPRGNFILSGSSAFLS